MLLTLATINFGLAAFDSWLTRRRMRDYGLNVELNPAIRFLCAVCGLEVGIMLGVMLPVAAQTLLLTWLNWPIAFALLIGFRTKLFVIQLQSLQFEKQLKAIRKELEIGDHSAEPPSIGQSASVKDRVDHVSDPPSSFKEGK